MNRIICILLTFISFHSFSQNPYTIEWERTYGGNSIDELNCVLSLSNGDFFLGGNTSSNNLDIQSGNNGDQDFWLVKIDSMGNIIWENTYGGSKTEMLFTIQPTNENEFLLGGITDSNDGDVQSGFSNGIGWNFWVVKIDDEGDIIWEKTYGGRNFDELKSICKTEDGNYLLGGYTQSDDGDVVSGLKGIRDYWLIKIDEDGNIIWEKTYGGSKEETFYHLEPTSDNSFLLGGSSLSDDGDISSGNKGGSDYWIVKIDNDGNIVWENTFGGSENEWIRTIEPTRDNGFLLGGVTKSKDGDIQNGFFGSEDYWIVKIDSEGIFQWENTYGGPDADQLYSMEEWMDGGVLLSGDFSGDFGLFHLDNQGVVEWEYSYGGSEGDWLRSLITINSNGIILGGTTWSNNGDIKSGNNGNGDFWILKLILKSPPTDIFVSSLNIEENRPIGTEIGLLETEDNDGEQSFLYSLVSGEGDTDNNSFSIKGTSLITDTIFDYETKNSYSIRIQTEDRVGNTFSKSFNVQIINENDIYIDDLRIVEPKCNDSPNGTIKYEVKEFVSPITFEWYPTGDTTQYLENITHGQYFVVIIDGFGDTLRQEINIHSQSIFKGTNICYITSHGQSNVINIDKGFNNYNVEKYLIYREGISQNEFEKIGEISCTENDFIDSLINNRTQSFGYKVSIIDSCGNESPLSSNHNTIHLSQNQGTSGEVNLYWTHYVGLNVPSYSIFRQTGNEDFELLQQISANNNTYSDFTSNPSFDYQYYISFELENTCNTDTTTKSGENIEVKSNTVSTDNTWTGIDDIINLEYRIYPNPVNDKLTIESSNSNQLELRLFDLTGNQIINQKEIYNKSKINLQSISSGVYFVKLLEDNTVVHHQTIVKY